MQQYLDLCHRIIEMGEWVTNRRTGKRCLTLINADLNYNVAAKSYCQIWCTGSGRVPV